MLGSTLFSGLSLFAAQKDIKIGVGVTKISHPLLPMTTGGLFLENFKHMK
jgi:hypothetical protein